MKPRRVVVSLDIETDAKVEHLRDKGRWDAFVTIPCDYFTVLEKPKVTVVKLKK